jgi:hypothetical protein
MTWKDNIKKEMPKGEGGKHTRMGEALGGMGMRITMDAINKKIRLYKKRDTKEAQEFVRLLEDAKDQALILVDKINDVNKFHEENKEPHIRVSGDGINYGARR